MFQELLEKLRSCEIASVAEKQVAAQKSNTQKKSDSSEVYYRKWLEEDVVYIITDEERTAFKRLSTDEEREQFIEQFWQRRNPDPTSADNVYKEEHYRRIQYANEAFAAGIPGWMTDQGRIYIILGPPQTIEDDSNINGVFPVPIRLEEDEVRDFRESAEKIRAFTQEVMEKMRE
jgi:GWxTD domain-containing protein